MDWWNNFHAPTRPYSPPINLVWVDDNPTAQTIYKVNEFLAGDIPFNERPTFRYIFNLFTCFAERLSYETTKNPYNHTHLVFNYRHQLLIDIKEVELRQYRKYTTHNNGPLQDIRLPRQDPPAQPPVPHGNAYTQNNN